MTENRHDVCDSYKKEGSYSSTFYITKNSLHRCKLIREIIMKFLILLLIDAPLLSIKMSQFRRFSAFTLIFRKQ